MTDTGEPCSVVDIGCSAPAGYMVDDEVTDGEDTAEHECAACGNAVCTPCSRLLRDQRRVCVYCAEGEALADDEKVELPPHTAGGMKVMRRHCDTCVFTDRSPLRPGRMRDLEQSWQSLDTHQTCHHAGVGNEEEGLIGEDIVCHGFFRSVFLTKGIGQGLRIAGRLIGYEYVEPPAFTPLHSLSEGAES